MHGKNIDILVPDRTGVIFYGYSANGDRMNGLQTYDGADNGLLFYDSVIFACCLNVKNLTLLPSIKKTEGVLADSEKSIFPINELLPGQLVNADAGDPLNFVARFNCWIEMGFAYLIGGVKFIQFSLENNLILRTSARYTQIVRVLN